MFLIDVTLSSYNCIVVVTAGLHMFVMKVVLFLYRCKSLTYEHNIRYNRGSPLPINRHLTFITYYLLTYNTYYISYDQTLRLLLFLAVDCLLGGTTSSSDSSTSSSSCSSNCFQICGTISQLTMSTEISFNHHVD